MKQIVLLATTLLFLLFCNTAGAQDRIYLRDGTVLKVKVKEIGPRNIVYRKWDNQDGPEYFVTRREVESIKYENGTEEIIEARASRRRSRDDEDDADEGKSTTMSKDDDDDRPARRHSSHDRERRAEPGYGANILTIAPIQMTNESVAGIGLQYERMLDKRQMFSLYIPVAVSFYTDEHYTVLGYNQKTQRSFTYFYPGVKVYPAGSAHRAAYSIGASVVLGFGTKYKEEQEQVYDPFSGTYYNQYVYKEGAVFKSGFMINNGLNLQPTRHFYIGLEFGIGFLYTNNESSDFTIGNEPVVQFNFKGGYRF